MPTMSFEHAVSAVEVASLEAEKLDRYDRLYALERIREHIEVVHSLFDTDDPDYSSLASCDVQLREDALRVDAMKDDEVQAFERLLATYIDVARELRPIAPDLDAFKQVMRNRHVLAAIGEHDVAAAFTIGVGDDAILSQPFPLERRAGPARSNAG